jgi:hypothetical protein
MKQFLVILLSLSLVVVMWPLYEQLLKRVMFMLGWVLSRLYNKRRAGKKRRFFFTILFEVVDFVLMLLCWSGFVFFGLVAWLNRRERNFFKPLEE